MDLQGFVGTTGLAALIQVALLLVRRDDRISVADPIWGGLNQNLQSLTALFVSSLLLPSKLGGSAPKTKTSAIAEALQVLVCRDDRIRTCGLFVPNEASRLWRGYISL